MHGDYEAQRHWMEITAHLPISQWYFYDLQYWGLDYPPLTAYHSWLLGKIGHFVDPTWFALDQSRGIERPLLKVYMRATVLISEYLVYVPALILLNRKYALLHGGNKWESYIILVAILMQPATMLIDHAHFQYNTVMLGFVNASVASIMSEHLLWSAIFFVGALCFKQMTLYYAPAMFAYLMGSCLLPQVKPLRLLGISIVTILSFSVAFAPLLLGALYDNLRGINPPLSITDRKVNPLFESVTDYIDPSSWYYPALLQLTQIIHRSFPFARGIFEDKVANLWCALHTFHKLNFYPIPLLQRISLLSTFIAILPACMIISLHPRKDLVPWALASTAWGFFLCSFQVHEKSVLLPLLPLTLALGGEEGLGSRLRAWIGWANILGAWTLFPLLKRDELRVPYFVLTGLWAYLLALPPTSLSLYFDFKSSKTVLDLPTTILHLTFYAAMIAWHVLEAFVETPKSKPDLWVVLNVLIGAAGFSICYAWCTWQLIKQSGILEEYFGYRTDQDAKPDHERAKALPLPWPLGPKTTPSTPQQKSKESSPKKLTARKSPEAKATSLDKKGEASPRKPGRPKKSS